MSQPQWAIDMESRFKESNKLGLQQQLEPIKAEVTQVKSRVDTIEKKQDTMEQRMHALKSGALGVGGATGWQPIYLEIKYRQLI